MNSVIENINKQLKRWLGNQKKSQLYKDQNSTRYDQFAHGYATGWVKALQAFKGWIAEFGNDGTLERMETEIQRMKKLQELPYAYISEEEKLSKIEAYDEVLNIITTIR